MSRKFVPTTRRRRYRRKGPTMGYRKGQKYQSGRFMRNLTVLPDSTPIIFKWSCLDTRTTGAGPDLRRFFGNAPNDPDFDQPNTKYLPLGWDEWYAFYSRLYCTSSRIVVRVYNPNALPVRVVLYPTNDVSNPLSMEVAITKPRAKQRLIGGDKDNHIIASSATTRQVTGERFDLSDWSVGMFSRPTRPAPGIAELNPVSQWYWNIASQCHDGSTAIALRYDVTMYFTCRMYDRSNLSASISTLQELSSAV